jgi:spermidine synthase
MSIANLTPEFLARHPEIAQRYRDESSYDLPFRFAQRLDNVLIVGAGAGNDAAAALRNGALQVDAVDIDPVFFYLGERLHPERPYSSAKVRKIVNDARAFFRQTREKYDFVLFGLLDSHTQFSDHSNIRIDNYVYTEEAFREAKRLLKPNGILIVKFEIRDPWSWMAPRFYTTLERLFGRPPIVFHAQRLGALFSGTIFVTSEDPSLWTRAAEPDLARLISSHPPPFPLQTADSPPPATDDWPYVYHRSRSIPQTYLIVSLILLGMSVLLVRKSLRPRKISTWHFFFLGAGFFLLETQMISRLALYFGTTWLVTCVALTAILLVLVLANLYVLHYRPRRLGLYYGLLVICLIAAYFFPWQQLPFGARVIGILLSAAYSVPIFFAGVVFAETFRRSEHKSDSFGANILGAIAGGLSQNLSFIVGMKALLGVAAFFYLLAGLCGMFLLRQAPVREALAPPSAEV